VIINIYTSFYDQCLAALSNEAHSPISSAIIKIFITDRILRIFNKKYFKLFNNINLPTGKIKKKNVLK
jgi:hypothetical protein